MKKLVSLLLALALVLSCCFAVMAEGEDDAADEPEDPESYFWVFDETTDAGADLGITFGVPGSKLTDGTYKVTVRAKFEGCEGNAFVNCYVYDDADSFNDFAHLISFKDFASSLDETVVDGEWAEITYEFNPCDGAYGSYDGQHIDASQIGLVTFGIGFYNAKGKVYVRNIQLNKDLEVIWAKGFSAGLDIEDDDDVIASTGLTTDNEGIAWGVVRPEIEDNGNIALGAEIDAPVGGGAYTASLNDGVAFGQQAYDNNWYGFNKNQNIVTASYDGKDYNCGVVTYDFGKVVDFTAVRAHMWDGAGSSGIATPTAIVVSSSNDGEAWEDLGTLTLGEAGTIYWAEKEFDDIVSAQFVKVEFFYEGTWLFVNEIEVIGAGVIDDDESSAEESKPAEESKTPAPKTGDAGMIALAVVSVVALAGVVVVKKSK